MKGKKFFRKLKIFGELREKMQGVKSIAEEQKDELGL